MHAGEAWRISSRALILAFAAGVGLLQSQPELPGRVWLGPLLLLPILATFAPARGAWRGALWLAVALLAGFGYAAWRAETRLADTLDPVWQGRDVRLTGHVAGLPETTPRGQRFELRVARVETQGAKVPSRVVLNLYEAPETFAPQAPVPRVRGGDCLALTARLTRPRGAHNPGGFDYEAWLFERGIRAQGRVMPASLSAGTCRDSFAARLDGWRESLRDRVRGHLAGAPYAGIVAALALGDQNAISSQEWRMFRRTGVTHLMSISGLHVTLLGWLVFTAIAWGWRRVPVLALRYPARHVAAWAGLGVSALYVALAGFGIPAQRTLYMLLALAVAASLDRLHSASRVLAAALLLVLLIDPWAVLAVGFWLSFGAVAALLYAGAGRLGERPRWHAWGHAQWAVTLALLPALLFLFQEFSLVSPLANAFAIPLISLAAVPLSLLAAILPWAWPAWLAHAVIEAVMHGLQWLDRMPSPVWHGAAPSLWATLLALAGAAVLLLPRGMPGRWLGTLLFLPLIWPRVERPGAGEYWLEALDVGQGLALVARTREHTLVYDGGPLYASGEDAGARVVAPRLHSLGIARLDGLVVSHDDTDHAGGALSLLASHSPGWLLSSLADNGSGRLSAHGRAILAEAGKPILCVAGQSWDWDGVRFQVLHPPARYHANPGFEDNDRSCVIRLSGAHGSALLTGDLARLGEMTLLEGDARELPSDVLVVGHHGSAGSTGRDFLAAVRPRWALISAGRGNPFGHPAPEVLRRLSDAGVGVWRTDRHGAVELRFQAGGMTVSATSPATRRYWHDLPARTVPAAIAGTVKGALDPQ